MGRTPRPIRGALAAAITPLQDGGAALDEAAVAPYVAFLAAGGVDGVLACGTTGEGVLLSVEERRRLLALVVEAAAPTQLAVIAHCGAQTTVDTCGLAADAAERGADAVAVIAPPYYAITPHEQLAHLEAAARACAPLPFYAYEFAARSGYAIAPETVERLRERAPNLRGLKVSDTPASAVLPYLLEGLDVFVGAETLLAEIPAAAGTVSGLGAVFPEVVAGVLRDPAGPAAAQAAALRPLLGGRFPQCAKALLGARGLPVGRDVRGPLLPLAPAEADALVARMREIVG